MSIFTEELIGALKGINDDYSRMLLADIAAIEDLISWNAPTFDVVVALQNLHTKVTFKLNNRTERASAELEDLISDIETILQENIQGIKNNALQHLTTLLHQARLETRITDAFSNAYYGIAQRAQADECYYLCESLTLLNSFPVIPDNYIKLYKYTHIKGIYELLLTLAQLKSLSPLNLQRILDEVNYCRSQEMPINLELLRNTIILRCETFRTQSAEAVEAFWVHLELIRAQEKSNARLASLEAQNEELLRKLNNFTVVIAETNLLNIKLQETLTNAEKAFKQQNEMLSEFISGKRNLGAENAGKRPARSLASQSVESGTAAKRSKAILTTPAVHHPFGLTLLRQPLSSTQSGIDAPVYMPAGTWHAKTPAAAGGSEEYSSEEEEKQGHTESSNNSDEGSQSPNQESDENEEGNFSSPSNPQHTM